MVTRPKDKRQVVRLSTTELDKSGRHYLSIQPCEMKDIRKGDIFFILEPEMNLVLGKDNKFLYRAKSNGIPHKDTFIVQGDEI